MFNTQIIVSGLTLNNVSSVTLETIDQTIADSIAKFGAVGTLQRTAQGAAGVADYLYRAVLHVGTVQGIFTLAGNDKGGFPAGNETIKSLLAAVSADSANSQRKQVSKILNYGWKVAQNGHSVFDFPSVSALEKAAKPAKILDVCTDADSINMSEEAAAAAAAEQAAAAAAAAAAAEQAAAVAAAAAAAAQAEAVAEAVAEAEAVAKQASECSIAILLADLQVALYGTKADKAYLLKAYPKAA